MSDSLREAMRSAGIDYAGDIHPDGKIHRFKPNGSRSRTGWYVLHHGEVLHGGFGCWKRGIKETFVDGKINSLSESERARLQEQWKRDDAKRQEKERRDAIRARATARQIMAASKPVKAHPYLSAKGIEATDGIRLHGDGRLIVPMRADGILHCLQYIDDEGGKLYLRGGQKEGASFEIQGDDNGPIVICEGMATGASIHKATGFTVICAMDCGNLIAVARAARARHPARQIIIAGDDDREALGNRGRTCGEATAAEVGAVAVFPAGIDGTDFNDLHAACGLDEVRVQITAAVDDKANGDRVVSWLAGLPPEDYDPLRVKVAAALRWRVGTLDERVRDKRLADQAIKPPQASWPDPVDGGELLDDIRREILRFCYMPTHCADALSAWILQTYVYEAFEFCAIGVVHSPEPQCGKGRVLEVVNALCRNGFWTSNVSAAVLYHKVSEGGLTVLIDELDSQSEDQRFAIGNILKSGFQSNGKAHRMAEVNGKQEIVEFPTYCPKIVASIGLNSLDKASRSRAISIPMQRKPRGAEVEKFRRYDGSETRSRCQRWATDNMDALRGVGPIRITECAQDRQEDVWEPLLTIGRIVGPDWEQRLRSACRTMCGGHDGGSESLENSVLSACHEFFRTGPAKVASKDLCSWLNANTDLASLRKDKGISPYLLAEKLRPYGIFVSPQRVGQEVFKGYSRDGFEVAFARYLDHPGPGIGILNGYTVTTPCKH